MNKTETGIATRRGFLSSAVAGAGVICARALRAEEPSDGEKPRKAQIAITLDLEMSRNFPVWEATRWDYEKGNLNDETKRYTVEACRRVKAAGGVLHSFVVGRVFEQPHVDWLRGIAAAGHPLGNHTYDHVNVTATKPEDIQFRFRRSPWLIEGRSAAEVIRENIRLASVALRTRVGVQAAGFRTPGGFSKGLAGRADVQRMILELGFTWVSSLYPPHALGKPKQQPTAEVFESIVAAGVKAQPFEYETGLIEVPMSAPSDITAFRGGRWQLEWFLEAVRRGVTWAIENRAAYDFLGHPSCLYVTDPKFRTIDMICQLVRDAGDRAEIVDLGTLAKRGVGRPAPMS
ncbi:MAG: polysaccharide deacetylase family protein [Planctomycetes bacterium]|nr:polysaccharide deacetylase family protein [Planctomycetota bacterium]